MAFQSVIELLDSVHTIQNQFRTLPKLAIGRIQNRARQKKYCIMHVERRDRENFVSLPNSCSGLENEIL